MTEQKARWESYADEVVGSDTPEMQAAVDEYAKHRYEGKSSTETEEKLAELKEENAAMVSEYRWLQPSEYADAGPRMGKIIHSSKLITILRKECGLHCWYTTHPLPGRLTLLVSKNGSQPREVGCWLAGGFMPEYSIMAFDDHGLPTSERYRGWRTVLMQLAIKGFLQQKDINRVFGPAKGPAQSRYNTFMFSLRTNNLRGDYA